MRISQEIFDTGKETKEEIRTMYRAGKCIEKYTNLIKHYDVMQVLRKRKNNN